MIVKSRLQIYDAAAPLAGDPDSGRCWGSERDSSHHYGNLDCLPQSAHHYCDFNHKTVASGRPPRLKPLVKDLAYANAAPDRTGTPVRHSRDIAVVCWEVRDSSSAGRIMLAASETGDEAGPPRASRG